LTECTNVTDRQTDTHTPYDSIGRACIASRGKNYRSMTSMYVAPVHQVSLTVICRICQLCDLLAQIGPNQQASYDSLWFSILDTVRFTNCYEWMNEWMNEWLADLFTNFRSTRWRYIYSRFRTNDKNRHPASKVIGKQVNASSTADAICGSRFFRSSELELWPLDLETVLWGTPDVRYLSSKFERCIEFSIFTARQHTDERYWYSKSVRPSVCLSVRYVPVLYENGLTYCHRFSTIR